MLQRDRTGFLDREGDRVGLRAVFMLTGGGKLEREWTLAEVLAGGGPISADEEPPAWLKNPKRRWGHPQDPILLTGKVRAGHEAEARAWLGLTDEA